MIKTGTFLVLCTTAFAVCLAEQPAPPNSLLAYEAMGNLSACRDAVMRNYVFAAITEKYRYDGDDVRQQTRLYLSGRKILSNVKYEAYSLIRSAPNEGIEDWYQFIWDNGKHYASRGTIRGVALLDEKGANEGEIDLHRRKIMRRSVFEPFMDSIALGGAFSHLKPSANLTESMFLSKAEVEKVSELGNGQIEIRWSLEPLKIKIWDGFKLWITTKHKKSEDLLPFEVRYTVQKDNGEPYDYSVTKVAWKQIREHKYGEGRVFVPDQIEANYYDNHINRNLRNQLVAKLLWEVNEKEVERMLNPATSARKKILEHFEIEHNTLQENGLRINKTTFSTTDYILEPIGK